MTPQLKDFDTAARTWLSGAGFPRELDSTLAKTIDEVTRHTASMNEDQLAMYAHAEYKRLQGIYGESLSERLQQAAVLVDQLERQKPGLKNMLRSRGIGDSSLIVSMLIQQAERWHLRRKG